MSEDTLSNNLIWNFDDAESREIFFMKQNFIYNRDSWKLDDAYWSLLSLFSEVKPLFEDKKELQEKFDKLTKLRDETDKFQCLKDNDKGSCFIALNDFYIDLCEEIVNKEYYFRKKKDYLGL